MYRDYKAKIKERRMDIGYNDIFYNILHSMFVYDDAIFRPDVLDFILHYDGKCALVKTDVSPYTPCIVEFAGGERYPDGTFSTAICFDANGKQYIFRDWLDNEDVVIIFNTPSRMPSFFVERLAYKMTEIDKSEDLNVQYSRLRPFPIVHDAKTKNMVESAMKSLHSGDFSAILTDVNIKSLVDGNHEEIPVLNLTNVKDSEEIQYLSHFYDNVLSRFFFWCGIGEPDNGKQAQITTEELNRNATASFTMPMIWYTSRKQAFDKIGMPFEFSPIWKSRFENIMAQNIGIEDEPSNGSNEDMLEERSEEDENSSGTEPSSDSDDEDKDGK